MCRKNLNTKHTNYQIRIVCEGEKTEPLFFTELCNEYLKDSYLEAKTIPEPYIPEDENTINISARRGGRDRKPRKTNDIPILNDVIYGKPPLKWVQVARKCISEGADEAWAAYDMDGHPTHKEALEEAEKVIDGKKVNIAFSSRSFEYYLLLHFEYIYKAFEKTECNSKLPKNNGRNCCGRNEAIFSALDCKGMRCINGYARIHNYWEESKKSISTYMRVKDHLLKGMVNACRLRLESDAESDRPFYERNPYTNADILVGRITGYKSVIFGECYNDSGACIWLEDDGMHIKNNSSISIIFKTSYLQYVNWEDNHTQAFVAGNKLITPDKEIIIECKLKPNVLIKYKSPKSENILFLPRQ